MTSPASGFYGIELFGNQIEAMEAHGSVGALLEKHNLPLISAYCGTNLSDPAQRKDSIAKTLAWAGLVKKYNGKVIVVGPNGVPRGTWDFNAHKDDIVATLNELGKAVTDMGLTPVLHQHTGTCVETRDETYAVLEAVDTRVMKFGPDIRQFTEGRVRSGAGRKGFPSACTTHAPEGLLWGQRVSGLLSPRTRQSGYSGNPRDDGGPQTRGCCDGRVGFPAAAARTGDRKRKNRESLSAKSRHHIPAAAINQPVSHVAFKHRRSEHAAGDTSASAQQLASRQRARVALVALQIVAAENQFLSEDAFRVPRNLARAPVGLEVYSVRNKLSRDMLGTATVVATMATG